MNIRNFTILIIPVTFALFPSIGLAQTVCGDVEPQTSWSFSFTMEGGPEADPQDINCTKTLKAIRGTKLVEIIATEYWQSGAPYCVEPTFEINCGSINEISVEQLSGGGGREF